MHLLPRIEYEPQFDAIMGIFFGILHYYFTIALKVAAASCRWNERLEAASTMLAYIKV